MKINKKIEIGIATCIALKGKDAPVSAQELSTQVGTSKEFLEHILRGLRQSQLVFVKRGPGGGYLLNPQKMPMSAMDIALSQGEEFAPFTAPTATAADLLNSNIISAFLNTQI